MNSSILLAKAASSLTKLRTSESEKSKMIELADIKYLSVSLVVFDRLLSYCQIHSLRNFRPNNMQSQNIGSIMNKDAAHYIFFWIYCQQGAILLVASILIDVLNEGCLLFHKYLIALYLGHTTYRYSCLD